MKNLRYLLLALTFLPLALWAQERKKVAVVLSGGGAKGVAHISALRIIEEAGLPVDMVVGTSMGALVGGLYSAGYSPDQLDSIVRKQDWRFLLSDNTRRNRLTFTARQRSNEYIFNFPFKKTPRGAIRGLVKGRNLDELFVHLLADFPDSINFDSLPIPFACVATDLAHDSEVVLRHGNLYTAMRASMSIPGAFEPVRLDSMMLVDGGLVNNFPVDVARKMGADYVIGVSVRDEDAGEEFNSITDVVLKITSIAGAKKYQDNIDDADVLIRVPVHGYNMASFSTAAIDTLLQRGQMASCEHWDELEALRQKLGFVNTQRAQRHTYHIRPTLLDSLKHPRYPVDALDTNSVNFGARFDSEELAVLLFGGSLTMPTRIPSQLSARLRLGKHIIGRAQYSLQMTPTGRLNAAYQLNYNDMNVYDEGTRAYNVSYVGHRGEVSLSSSWRTIKAEVGLRYEQFHFKDFLANYAYQLADGVENEHYLSYFADFRFDDFNRKSYPTRGMRWHLRGALYTDNFVSYNEHAPILCLQGSWEGTARLMGTKLMLLPFFYGRGIFRSERPYTLGTFIGGTYAGRYMSQQMPFMGVANIETGADYTGIGGVRLRQRIGRSSYVTLTANYGFLLDKDDDGDYESENIVGAGLTYGYDSFIGPLEATLSYSNRTKEVNFFINVGLEF